MGSIVVRACNARRQPLADEMDVIVASAQGGHVAATVRAVRGDAAIRVEGLIEGRPYTVRVFPTRHRPVAQFAVAGPDASPAEVTLHCPLHPAHVRAATFPDYGDVHADLRRVLDASSVDGIDGQGEALYAGLSSPQKAGLFNLFTKMSRVSLDPSCTPWTFVERVFAVRADRLFADVRPDLLARVESAVVAALFRAVPGSLHEPPAGFGHAGSFKTLEPYGNLQLTFFSCAQVPILKVDADIDDAAGLRHTFQVIRNFVTGDPTHPYDIHQILVFRQEAALPYELA
jgi:hypothetical protein